MKPPVRSATARLHADARNCSGPRICVEEERQLILRGSATQRETDAAALQMNDAQSPRPLPLAPASRRLVRQRHTGT